MSLPRINLDLIEMPIPCTVPWESMQGDDKVRHCNQCNQKVYHLSNMSKEEAEELIRSKEGKMCARVYRRPDGSVVTRSCVAIRWSKPIFNTVMFTCIAALSLLGFSKLMRSAPANETFSFVCQGVIVP